MSRLKKNLLKIVSACICLVLLVSVPVSAKGKHFTKEEDGIILRLVQQYGANNWRKIATLLSKWRSENGMGGRSRYSVRDRYKYYLDPTLNRNPFTPEEDDCLLQAVQKFGSSCSKLSALFPNRSYCSIRNRYKQLYLYNKPKEIKLDNLRNFSDFFPDCKSRVNFLSSTMPTQIEQSPEEKPKQPPDTGKVLNGFVSNSSEFDFFKEFGEEVDFFSVQ